MENFGNAVMDAYFRGVQMRTQRQQVENNKIQDQNELKLRQQVADDHAKQFKDQQAQQEQHFNKTHALQKAANELHNFEAKGRFERDINDQVAAGRGTREPIPGMIGQDNFVPFSTPLEMGQGAAAAQAPVLEAQANKAISVENNAAINRQELDSQKAVEAQALQAKKEAGLDARNAATNTARLLAANLKISAAKTRGETKAGLNEAGDSYATLKENIMDGHITKEGLRTSGFTGVKEQTIALEAAKNGVHILDRAQEKDLTNIGEFANIYKIAVKLNEAYKSLDLPKAYLYEKELDAAKGKLAAAIGNEKGVLTQKDIERQEGNLPTKMKGLLGQNDEALKNLFVFYKTKRDLALRAVRGDEQRARLYKTFQLMPDQDPSMPTKIPKQGAK